MNRPIFSVIVPTYGRPQQRASGEPILNRQPGHH
jgi:hypothetical protein